MSKEAFLSIENRMDELEVEYTLIERENDMKLKELK